MRDIRSDGNGGVIVPRWLVSAVVPILLTSVIGFAIWITQQVAAANDRFGAEMVKVNDRLTRVEERREMLDAESARDRMGLHVQLDRLVANNELLREIQAQLRDLGDLLRRELADERPLRRSDAVAVPGDNPSRDIKRRPPSP